MKYGETPWDKLSRDELLLEAQRMASALVAARGVLKNSRLGNETSPYWRDGGSGLDAIDKTEAALHLYDKVGDEACYRAFFRYADDLLFPPARPELGWMYCETCKDMIKNTTLGIEVGRACYRCKSPRRPMTWADLSPMRET